MVNVSQLDDQAKADLAALAIELSKDVEGRKLINKKLKPLGKSLPDVDLADLSASIDNKFAERDQQENARRMNDHLESQKNGLRSRGFKDEDIANMETNIMQKHGISDYDVAAKVFAADARPADPTHEIKTRTWQMPTLGEKQIHNSADIANFARERAYQVVNEFKNKRA